MSQKEIRAKALKDELMEAKEQLSDKLYKNVQSYLAMFKSTIRERDPAEEQLSSNQSLIRSSLEDSPSLENISSRIPVHNMNR